MTIGSVERVRAALAAAGHPDTIVTFPEGTRTAADAAAAVQCTVAQIAKSIVFRSGGRPVLVVASGVNRIDRAKVARALEREVAPADARWVREVSGFAIGGVAPVGHLTPPLVVVDRDLMGLDPIWAAAGSPQHVFRTNGQELLRVSGGHPADVKQDPMDQANS